MSLSSSSSRLLLLLSSSSLVLPVHRFFAPAISPLIHLRYSSSSSSPVDEEEQLARARTWLANLSPSTIPKSICDISYSRSSGPGGQNVNKRSTKTTLRISLSSLSPHIPKPIFSHLLHSHHYTPASHSLLIQSDEERRQTDNIDACFRKLLDAIKQAGKQAVPGETSEEQKRRVKGLKQRENESRLKRKKMLGAKKKDRGKQRFDD